MRMTDPRLYTLAALIDLTRQKTKYTIYYSCGRLIEHCQELFDIDHMLTVDKINRYLTLDVEEGSVVKIFGESKRRSTALYRANLTHSANACKGPEYYKRKEQSSHNNDE